MPAERKFYNFLSGVILGAFFIFGNPAFAATLMVSDFDTGGQPNNVGGNFGTWSINPDDQTQGCEMDIVRLPDVIGKESFVLKIDYDVAAATPAFNGLWMELNKLDITPYDEMSMLIKGDEGRGFTTQFKLELKNAKGERAIYTVKGITNKWQQIVIPMEKMKMIDSISDWSKMTELVFVFDDLNVSYKEGTLYIDEITFSSKGVVQ